MSVKLWDVAAVADLTGWSKYTVREKARKGTIPAVRIDGRIYFRPAAVEKWLAALPSAK